MYERCLPTLSSDHCGACRSCLLEILAIAAALCHCENKQQAETGCAHNTTTRMISTPLGDGSYRFLNSKRDHILLLACSLQLQARQ